MAAEFAKKHILFLPFPAIGHITPLLQLATKISKFHDVTFAISELKLDEIRKKDIIKEHCQSNIKFLGLRDGLTAEDDKDVSLQGLIRNAEKMEAVVRTLFENMPIPSDPKSGEPCGIILPVDVVISDIGAFLGADVLIQRGVPYMVFNSAAGFVFSNKLNIDQNTPTIPDDVFFSSWENQPDVAVAGIPECYKKYIDAFAGALSSVQAFIFNSIAELETETISVMSNHPLSKGKLLQFVAPLFLEDQTGSSPETSKTVGSVQAWLNRQEEQSVIYLSFGSMALAAKSQITEIAKALISLNKPFIWSLKSDEQKNLPAEILDAIPNQFESANFLILDWAPQKKILEHLATKLFISHCGWNSTLESFLNGIPIIAWPMFGDQYGNAALVEKLKTGVVLQDTSMLCTKIIPAEQIVDAVLTVGEWKKCVPEVRFKENSQSLSVTLTKAANPGGSSYNAFQELIQFKF